jgi:hypothetical protein
VVPTDAEACAAARLFLKDECLDSMDPAKSSLLLGGDSHPLTSYDWTLEVCPPTEQDCDAAPLNLIVQEKALEPSPHETTELFAGMLTRSVNDDAVVDLFVDPEPPPHAFCLPCDRLPALGPTLFDGVWGWSLSLGLDGDLKLVDATTDGTAAAFSPDGLNSAGFLQTEIIDPAAAGGQGQGVISSVLLTIDHPNALELKGTATVIQLTLEAHFTAGSPVVEGSLRCMDGKVGSRLPSENYAIVKGVGERFCRCQGVRIVLHATPSSGSFVRCDSNDDGRLDIADAIWILNELFYGGPPTRCRDAADCDGDGQMALGDALFALEHEFQAGRPAPNSLSGLRKGRRDDGRELPRAVHPLPVAPARLRDRVSRSLSASRAVLRDDNLLWYCVKAQPKPTQRARPVQRNGRTAVGRTASGRYLRVVYVPDPELDSVFVITAHELGPKAKHALRRRRRRKP